MTHPVGRRIQELWRETSEANGLPPVERPNFGEFLEEQRASEVLRGLEHLEPWASLSTEALQWISHLHICLSDHISRSDRHRCTWALTGFASAHGNAIRNLALSGLDVAARSLLRSFIESMMYAVVLLNDENLAKRYVAAQEPEDARRLWNAELRGRVLRNKFEATTGTSDEETKAALDEFSEWFSDESTAHSQAVHASYLAAVMASTPPDIETGEMAPGIFGRVTEASVRTLSLLFHATWFFSRFLATGVLGLGPGANIRLCDFDREKYFDATVIAGFYVLGELSAEYWQDAEQATPAD